MLVLSGATFWIGLVGTIVMSVRIHMFGKREKAAEQKKAQTKRIGLISFFQNREAMVADVAMFASILGLVITAAATNNLYWLFTFLAVLVFSFGMHCVLNGKNYHYLNNKVEGEKV